MCIRDRFYRIVVAYSIRAREGKFIDQIGTYNPMLLKDCVDRVKQGTLDAATASMAKYWGSQTQNEIMDGCLQLHGGYGFIMEYPIARMSADARVQSIYGGTNAIMKELIARSLDD